MTVLNPADFRLEVSKGNVAGHKSVNKYGYNPDVDLAADEDIWELGGNIIYPTAAEALEFISSSPSDANGGNGAEKITIEGIDSSLNFFSTEYTTNGTTAVACGTRWRVFRAYVSDAGVLAGNFGTITIRTVAGSTERLRITSDKGQSNYCSYSVPTGSKAYIYGYEATLNEGSPSGVTADVQLWVQETFDVTGRVKKQKENFGLTIDGTSAWRRNFATPLQMVGPCDIWIRADVSTNDTFVAASFDLIEVED